MDNTTSATGTVQTGGIVARFSTVPEPSTWAVLFVGGALLTGLAVRMRRSVG